MTDRKIPYITLIYQNLGVFAVDFRTAAVVPRMTAVDRILAFAFSGAGANALRDGPLGRNAARRSSEGI